MTLQPQFEDELYAIDNTALQEGLMLKTLFGEISARRRASQAHRDQTDDNDGFAATAIMESMLDDPAPSHTLTATASGKHELMVSGSVSSALRTHLAEVNSKHPLETQLMVIIDPVRVWANLVISMLSQTHTQPIEHLYLREQESHRTLATIESATVVDNAGERLKVSHADVRPLTDANDIQAPLMELSQMTAVIVGPMQAHAIDALMASLKKASSLSSWRCPVLLFMLPPNSAWIQHKIQSITWPVSLQVLMLEEPMVSASVVWNLLAAQWRLAKAPKNLARDVLLARRHEEFQFSAPAASPTPPKMVITPELASAAGRPQRGAPAAEQVHVAWEKMSVMEGMLACALVNDETSQVMARDTRLGYTVNLEETATACAQLMRAHRQSATLMGLTRVDEITTSSGARQVMLRPASGRPGFFMMALLDKQRTNMTLARLKLIELDKQLS